MRLFTLSMLCWISLVSIAAAQTDSRWLVLPAASGTDAAWMGSAASRVRAAIVDGGQGAWSAEKASARFESEASAPSSELSPGELQRWASLSDQAVNDLAEGDYAKALKKLNAAQDISRDAIDELNRDPERARRVFDSCLYIVRAVLATESESRARSVARECRQLVPRAEPSAYMHPPSVTDLLDQTDALQAKQTGELRVESTPAGCEARLNGVLLGETPVSVDGLFPAEYRVQVECDPGERGRVHFVTVGAGKTQHEVDTLFDQAVTSRPALALRYANDRERTKRQAADVGHVARALGAAEVLLLTKPSKDTMEIRLVETTKAPPPAPAALARISVDESGPSQAELADAIGTLLARRCVDFSSGEPSSLPCASDAAVETVAAASPDGWPEDRRPRGQFIAGLTLAGIGIAGLTTGYVLLIPRRDAALDWIDQVDTGGQNTAPQQKWFDLRGAIIATSSVGSVALVTAMPLALPERDNTPWWAWVSGGVGLGLAGFSVAWGVTAEDEPNTPCSSEMLNGDEVRACVNRGSQTSVALLTGLTAAPLITMPLVYLFRPNRAKLEPHVELGRSRAYFGLRGRF